MQTNKKDRQKLSGLVAALDHLNASREEHQEHLERMDDEETAEYIRRGREEIQRIYAVDSILSWLERHEEYFDEFYDEVQR